MTATVRKAALGRWGERLVGRHALRIVGEAVRRVRAGNGPDLRSARYAIEVKTVLAGREAKIRSAAAAIRRKQAYAAATGKQGLSIVIIYAPATETARVYRRDGFAAYRVGGMAYVGTFDLAREIAERASAAPAPREA